MGLKVAILGTTLHRTQAPFADETWEIWGINNPDLPRWSRWSELHNPNLIKTQFTSLWEWLRKSDGSKPIYMRDANSEVQGSVKFPRDQLVQEFGRRFFTSSVAWLMALAIYEGATDIGIYGVDMACDTEYAHQKPGCLHFMQVAEDRGINLVIPVESQLNVPTRLYALDDEWWLDEQLAEHKRDFDQQLNAIQIAQRNMDNEALQLHGALRMLEKMKTNWGSQR